MKPIISFLPSLLFSLLVLMLGLTACNTPSDIVIGPTTAKVYSGQINGEVTVSQSDLGAVNKSREQFVTYLKENLRVIELTIKENPGPSLPKQYYFMTHEGTKVDLNPRVTISSKSTATDVVFSYSFGEVSRAVPLQDPTKPTVLSMLKPYRVLTPANIPRPNGYLGFTEEAEAVYNNFQVVYLTECDPVYNEYHFVSNMSVIN